MQRKLDKVLELGLLSLDLSLDSAVSASSLSLLVLASWTEIWLFKP